MKNYAEVPELDAVRTKPKKSNPDKFLTPEVKAFFKELIEDSGNWGSTVLFGGNVGGDKQSCGYLANLKKAGILTTEQDEENKRCQWVSFTEKAYYLGVEVGANMKAACFWGGTQGWQYDDYVKKVLEDKAKAFHEDKPAKPKKKTIKGKTAEQFIYFLESTLIPDLKESGTIYTAQDFETAIKWIKHYKDLKLTK